MTLASICAEGELYDTAVKLAEEAMAKSSRMGGMIPRLSEYLYDILGKSYLGAKRYEEAVDAYKQVARSCQLRRDARNGREENTSSLH